MRECQDSRLDAYGRPLSSARKCVGCYVSYENAEHHGFCLSCADTAWELWLEHKILPTMLCGGEQ